MCKLTKKLLIQGVVGYSGFRGEDLKRGEGEIKEGLRPPSELCTY